MKPRGNRRQHPSPPLNAGVDKNQTVGYLLAMETFYPKDETHWLKLRAQDVTSTEIAALFGCSPYMTAYELWHRHKGNVVVEFEANERTKWGTRLQASIAEGIAEEQGWIIRPMTEYIRLPELRMGSSFDYAISVGNGLLEIKNVDSLVFKEGWIVDGDDVEAPLHIELQVQHQLAVSGRSFAYIGALVGGNRLVLLKRERDEEIIEAIKQKVKEFWHSVDNNIEPSPEFEKDADFIARLYNHAEPGSVIEANQELSVLAEQYKMYSDQASEFDKKKQGVKAQILTIINEAEKVLGPNFTISSGVIGPTVVPSFERKGYRNFRISWKKEKA